MPKGRMINKKISLNKTLPKVSNDARLLFTWCIPHLDCEGKIHANPSLIKGVVVPYLDDYTIKKIQKCIDELANTPLVIVYGKDVKYMKFLGFDTEQTLNTSREAPSEIPDPTEDEIMRHSEFTPELIGNNASTTPGKDKTSKDKISKVKVREDVSISLPETEKLIEKYGKDFTEKCFDKLNNYKLSRGRKYNSDYRAILNWVVEAVQEDERKTGNRTDQKQSRGSVDFNKFKEEYLASGGEE